MMDFEKNDVGKNFIISILFFLGVYAVIFIIVNCFTPKPEPPKPLNDEVWLTKTLILEKGYDLDLTEYGAMYVKGDVSNHGETIAATDLKLTFDTYSGDKKVGECFAVNSEEIKLGKSWHLGSGIPLFHFSCWNETDSPSYSGDGIVIDGVKFASYSLGNKPYYDELFGKN